MTSEPSFEHSEAAADTDLRARIKDLEHTIELNEQQLRVRGMVIRRLRRELADAHASLERLTGSRTYRLASGMKRVLVARPRELSIAVRERIMGGRR